MEPTVVGVVHADEGVRRAIAERLEGEQGLLLAAVAARLDELRLPEAVRRVLVVGGLALEDPDLARAGIPVVVAASGRLSEARLALAIGAADLVGWPRDAGELAPSIRRVAAARSGQPQAAAGRILAVVGARGGLGTTTIAAWVARGLEAQAFVELDAAGSLSTYGPDAEASLDGLLSGTGVEGARGSLREVGIGVPVAFGEPGMREPPAPALRAMLASLRALGGWSVVDAGRGDGSRLSVARAADARLLVLGDEVACVRAIVARRLAGNPWILRTAGRRPRIPERDLIDALGAPPLATIACDPAVARAADLGALASVPAGITAALGGLDPGIPAANVIGHSRPAFAARLRAAVGALR